MVLKLFLSLNSLELRILLRQCPGTGPAGVLSQLKSVFVLSRIEITQRNLSSSIIM